MILGISAAFTGLANKQFSLGGLPAARLAQGLALPGVTNAARFGEWNDLSEFFDRAAECVGGEHGLADLCEAVAVPALPEGRALMAISPDIATGIQLISRLCDATFGPAVRYPAFRKTGPNRFHVQLRVPHQRGQRECPAYFRGMEGAFRTSAKYAGSRESVSVKTLIQGRRADFEIELPEWVGAGEPPRERAVKAAFVRNWQRDLRASRRALLEQRTFELKARESSIFASLSAAVARAILRREREDLPGAAAAAVQEVLKCRRVVISRSGPSGKELLAVVGPPVRNVRVAQLSIGETVLELAADVQPSSPEARALENLLPWLAIVCSKSGAAPPAVDPKPRVDARLHQLAGQWRLTARQEQVALLMVQGESNKGIAAILGLSEGTVELHAHAVLKKSLLSSRTALAAHFFNGV